MAAAPQSLGLSPQDIDDLKLIRSKLKPNDPRIAKLDALLSAAAPSIPGGEVLPDTQAQAQALATRALSPETQAGAEFLQKIAIPGGKPLGQASPAAPRITPEAMELAGVESTGRAIENIPTAAGILSSAFTGGLPLLARAGIAAGAAGGGAGLIGATPEEALTTGAVQGVAPELGAAGLGQIAKGLSPAASRALSRILGISEKAVQFGREPVEEVLRQGIQGRSIPTLVENIGKANREVTKQLEKVLETSDNFVYHATSKVNADAIRQGGIKAGSFFAKTPQEALSFGRSRTPSGLSSDVVIFKVPKAEMRPVAADPADVFGDEFIKAKIFTRSGTTHMPVGEVSGSAISPQFAAPKTIDAQSLALQVASNIPNTSVSSRFLGLVDDAASKLGLTNLDSLTPSQANALKKEIAKSARFVEGDIRAVIGNANKTFGGRLRDGIVTAVPEAEGLLETSANLTEASKAGQLMVRKLKVGRGPQSVDLHRPETWPRVFTDTTLQARTLFKAAEVLSQTTPVSNALRIAFRLVFPQSSGAEDDEP